jgi:hypothetical protein
MDNATALRITVDTIKLDATLTGEEVNLNRVTFWLSELSYGRKWIGDSWSHVVPRDIIQTAAELASTEWTPNQLVQLAIASTK